MKLGPYYGLRPVKDKAGPFSNICSTVLWRTFSLAVKWYVIDEVKKDPFKIILIKLQDQWTVKQVCLPVGLCHWLTVELLVWMCSPNGLALLNDNVSPPGLYSPKSAMNEILLDFKGQRSFGGIRYILSLPHRELKFFLQRKYIWQ